MVESFSSQLQVRITTAVMVAMDTAVAEQEADTTAGYYGQDGGSTMAPMVKTPTVIWAGRALVSTLER